MNNNAQIKKKSKKGNNTEAHTLNLVNVDGSTISKPMDNNSSPQYYELYKKIIELETKNEQISSQMKNITSNVFAIRKKENRLLNRFGWTLIMANILLGVLAAIVVLGYFQFFYPTLQKNINSDGVFELIKWIMFGILGGIVTIWISVMKFAKYIKKRDQIDNEEI